MAIEAAIQWWKMGGGDGAEVSERSPLPTQAEFEILRILWKRGPSTVREVHEAHLESRSVRYTTVLRLLQNMHAKGFVRRDDSARSHVFESALPELETESRFLDEFVDEVFEGSTSRLVLRALSREIASPSEIKEIAALLERLETEAAEGASEQENG